METTVSENGANRIAKQDRRAPGMFSEIGVTGLEHSGGLVLEEFVRKLQGDRWLKVAREMSENDDVVGASLTAFEMLCRQVEWRVEPASDAPEDMEAQEYLSGVMEDMSHGWAEFISEALSMLSYGFDVHEIVYKKRNGPNRKPGQSSKFTDGKVGVRKLAARAQDTRDRWLFDDDGGVQAFVQRDPNSAKTYAIPIERLLLFRTAHSKGSPEGRSLIRRAYVPWYFKTKIQRLEAIGVERDLAGLPTITFPPEWGHADASAEEKAALAELKKIVVNIRQDEQGGVLLPFMKDEDGDSVIELKLLSTGGQRQFDTNAIVLRYDRAIAGTMMADFILLGHEKVGSFALADTKTDLFTLAIDAVLDSIASVLNRHMVPRLFRLNGAPERMMFPRFVYGDIEKVDVSRFADAVQKLTASGWALFPDDDAEQYVRGLLDIPGERVEQEL